jgi:CubicO group peptidase (beta-lactamase class C family)
MSASPVKNAPGLGFDPTRLARAFRLVEEWTRTGVLPAAGVCVGRKERYLEPRVFGKMGPEDHARKADPSTLFLVASLTKPVTVTAAMLLVERGTLALDDRVADYVPEFGQNGKHDVRIRHLMTHTSGLPDMPPNNEALREAHAPLSRFIKEVTRLPLSFVPGTQVAYQSMGTAMLAEVVQRIAGISLPEFLRTEVFEPLGMLDTSLGWQPAKRERIATIRLSPEQSRTDWNWNSPYWLSMSAPWGGLITSPVDFSRFCRMMLNDGTLGETRLLSPATVRAMTSNQLTAFPSVPEFQRRCRPWGLGWRLSWPGDSAHFGDLLGPRTFGHWGATGTLCWIDPDSDVFLVLLTTQPCGDDGRHLALASNAFAAATL